MVTVYVGKVSVIELPAPDDSVFATQSVHFSRADPQGCRRGGKENLANRGPIGNWKLENVDSFALFILFY